MTRPQAKKLQYTRCACGSAFRGENLKAHLKAPKTLAENKEVENAHCGVARVYFCVAHLEFAGEEEVSAFSSKHWSCSNDGPRPSKRDIAEITHRKVPLALKKAVEEVGSTEEKKVEEKKVREAEEEVAAATAWLEAEKKRALEEEEDDFLVVTPKRRRLNVDLDETASDEFVFEPNATSSPAEERHDEEAEEKKTEEKKTEEKVEEKKTEEKVEEKKTEEKKNSIRLQKEWSRDSAVEASQRKAHLNLLARLNNAIAERDRAWREAALAKAKADMASKWQRQVEGLLAEKQESRVREREMREELARVRKEKEEVDARCMAQSNDLKIQAAKAEEAGVINTKLAKRVEALETEKRELRSKKSAARELRLTAHTACHQGRIIQTMVQEDDGDRTDTCFENTERGIHCHHIRIHQDMDAKLSVRVRNSRRVQLDGKE